MIAQTEKSIKKTVTETSLEKIMQNEPSNDVSNKEDTSLTINSNFSSQNVEKEVSDSDVQNLLIPTERNDGARDKDLKNGENCVTLSEESNGRVEDIVEMRNNLRPTPDKNKIKRHAYREPKIIEKNFKNGECCADSVEDTAALSETPKRLEISVEISHLSFENDVLKDVDFDESQEFERESNFHEAVRGGDAERVAAMIARRAVQDLDEPDWNVTGDPPLLVAATNHCLPVLSTLLENGCDPTVRSPRGETALHRAIQNGSPGAVLKFVEKLLEYGCPASVKEAGGGLTALHILTRQLSHTQISKSIHSDFDKAFKTLDLLAKASPVDAKDHQGRSALHILASSTIFDNNHASEVEQLIQILLEAGADPASTNDRGETALHESLECGALNTASLLMPFTPVGITSRYGETPLHIAAKKNYMEMIAKLLEHGEDPSVQDVGGNTPLHLASARGFHQVVSLLVTSPMAQLEKTNNEGLTSLQVATESGFVNTVRLLLQAGADPSQSISSRTSTLRHRHPDITVMIDHELTRRRQLAA